MLSRIPCVHADRLCKGAGHCDGLSSLAPGRPQSLLMPFALPMLIRPRSQQQQKTVPLGKRGWAFCWMAQRIRINTTGLSPQSTLRTSHPGGAAFWWLRCPWAPPGGWHYLPSSGAGWMLPETIPYIFSMTVLMANVLSLDLGPPTQQTKGFAFGSAANDNSSIYISLTVEQAQFKNPLHILAQSSSQQGCELGTIILRWQMRKRRHQKFK